MIDSPSKCPSYERKDDLYWETQVLGKIRAEIHATAEMHEDGNYYLRDEWIDEIIDKYKEGEK